MATDHTIEAHFKVDASQAGGLVKPEPVQWTHFFKNFNMEPDGKITIKNFHPEFRDRLQAVLLDENLPFSPILPIIARLR
jgi:hypothetical protein